MLIEQNLIHQPYPTQPSLLSATTLPPPKLPNFLATTTSPTHQAKRYLSCQRNSALQSCSLRAAIIALITCVKPFADPTLDQEGATPLKA